MPDLELFNRFAPAVRSFAGRPDVPDLLIARNGKLATYYAPFDWVNPEARVILVGITPGRIQAINALREAQRLMRRGATEDLVLAKAKQVGAFSGTLRPNLVRLLDHIGLDDWLGVDSVTALFSDRSDLLQSSSVLQYPVFVEGAKDGNYKGAPGITATPFLRDLVVRFFRPMVESLPGAVIIPLGDAAARTVQWLAESGQIEPRAVLLGLPHPSGANAERISYFLGRKPRSELSAKTDPERIDAARTSLMRAVAALRPIQ